MQRIVLAFDVVNYRSLHFAALMQAASRDEKAEKSLK